MVAFKHLGVNAKFGSENFHVAAGTYQDQNGLLAD